MWANMIFLSKPASQFWYSRFSTWIPTVFIFSFSNLICYMLSYKRNTFICAFPGMTVCMCLYKSKHAHLCLHGWPCNSVSVCFFVQLHHSLHSPSILSILLGRHRRGAQGILNGVGYDQPPLPSLICQTFFLDISIHLSINFLCLLIHSWVAGARYIKAIKRFWNHWNCG